MAEIRMEGKPVVASAGHLYLVYVNDAGEEFVRRGGPANDIFPGASNSGGKLSLTSAMRDEAAVE